MSKPDPQDLSALTTAQWSLSGEVLSKTYRFDTFRQSMAFVTQVAALAEQRNHHPSIRIDYNKVHLELTTHDAGGLTDKDTGLARKIEGL
ncbi:Putative pterin-4-alpha-carbinolamine dehydratase [Aquimixticola soesokkakensis]|uniref:4a-hydroxytetrahydrobiopterin dehydratase n=1 Tax=Aquimixticola soesokkakensis TaxID=1519096 RepID=A0A1Y5RFP7_9RHOB|nr:4a-hydroxytetrahydrobiopterin dehydratase [Aquimixticola soesokkakensis]SLN16451.1 Putative pterin-4-alpha-carbinolamine dehydratase [Aquimixticola soesokkakensis]